VARDFLQRPQVEAAACRTTLGLPNDGSWLILVFGRSFYKNAETSLAVVKNLAGVLRRRAFLVRVGPITEAWRKSVRDAGMDGRTIELPEVASMPELYSAVDCLLFPSWYEGFGLPPLEAMACGIPVVASDAASLPEVVGHAALMAPPGDVHGLTAAVRLLLEDPNRRAEQVAKGINHARKFTWERTARETIAVYERVLTNS